MELRNLKTFCKICEQMSFSRAAHLLGYSQSTVTGQIRQLEEELRTPLFERTGKKFIISEAGQQLREYAERILALEEEAASAIANDDVPRGLLKVGVIESICTSFLPLCLGNFLRKYPNVQLEVQTATTLQIMKMLREQQVDLILTLDESVYNAAWTTVWSRENEILFLCAPDHPFAGRKDVSMEELLAENLILTEKGCNYRKVFEDELRRRHADCRSSLEIGNTANILQLTAAGLGVTFLPQYTAIADLRRGTLARFTLRDYHMSMDIQAIYRTSTRLTPAMRAFMDTAKQGADSSVF